MISRKFYIFISIFGFGAVCAAPSLPIFLIDANTVILDKYINTRNIDLQKWSAHLLKTALSACSSTCDEEVVGNILIDEVRQIGDPHFEVMNPASTRIEDSFPVGDGHHITSFGFVLERDQSDVVVRYIHPESAAADVFQIGDRILSVSGVDEQDTLRAIAFAERFDKRLEFKYSRNGDVKTVLLLPYSEDWSAKYTILENKVLWLRITNTMGKADRIVHDAIQAAKADGLKGVVLDLRYRSGGAPFTALNIAGAFVPLAGTSFCDREKVCIDYAFDAGATKYFNPNTNERSTEYFENPSFWDGPLVVLTSKYTFSGGENLANILQGLKRAKVLGEESGGGAGVTGNAFSVRYSEKTRKYTFMFIPQYRQYDLFTKVARPLKVIPDQLVPIDLEKLKAGRDNQLEAAIEELGIK
jgi:C-terminal processing protease CtpA/Prc